MNQPAIEWLPEELDACRPPARMKISEWAAKYRVLSEHSAIKGPYQLAMVPFLVPMMNACADWDTDEIVFCKPAQIGGTDAILNIVGFYSDQDPSPIMVILADENTAKYVSTKKLTPMFRDSEHLRRLYNPNNFDKTEIDLLNGGYIALGWASSVGMMATRPMRIVIFEEIDKPGYFVTTREADALSLGRERTNTYPSGYLKHILSSTPTTAEGNIISELDSCDIIFDWHVPCPRCGQFQPLRWSQDYSYGFSDGLYRSDDGMMRKLGHVVWDGGRKASKKQILETARYECGECQAHWTTEEKNEAVRKGRSVPRTEPTGFERKKGFHVNRIYSLFDGGRLDKLIERWVGIFKLSAEKKKKALQGFINSTLAEPFRLVVITSSQSKILNARCDLPAQTVPQAAVVLTAGIDVQKYGFWFVVRAWARDYVSWLIHYGFLGDWQELENLLFETAYPVQDAENDQAMRIWRAAIDTGGGAKETGMSMTEETYWWIRKNAVGRGCRVWGTKGASRPLAGKVHIGKVLDKTPSGRPIPGGLQNILVDSHKLKDLIYYRLGQAINGEEQSAYLHMDTDQRYSRQILADEKQLDKRGLEQWVQVGKDNHLLDAETLCHVVADPEWPGGGVNLIRGPTRAAPKRSISDREGSNRAWIPKTLNWMGR